MYCTEYYKVKDKALMILKAKYEPGMRLISEIRLQFGRVTATVDVDSALVA